MRIYEGTPRRDYEEVLRSIGAFVDQRGMREILLAEAPDGFIVQGLVDSIVPPGAWNEPGASTGKETYTFLDEDVARFMEDAISRRRRGEPGPDAAMAGPYEQSLRVLGRYIDEQQPRDVFFFEQQGAYVLRLLASARSGPRHILVEFTPEDIAAMVAEGRRRRQPAGP
jgi:hypothetical protein